MYRKIFKLIHRVLQKQTGTAQERLNSFFIELPQAHAQLFQGVRFDAEGGLPVEDVLDNAEVLHDSPAHAHTHAMEALEALLAFALFEARDAMEGEKADRLLREVGKLQTQTKGKP